MATDAMSELPPGFTLDELPAGFTVDAPQQTETPSRFAQANKTASDALAAVPEGVANFVSSSIAGPAGKVAGAITGVGDNAAKAMGLDPMGPRVEKAVQSGLTYEPKTKGGQTVANILSTPGRLFGQFTNWAGRKTEEGTGSKMAGEAVQKSLEIAPYGIGRGPGRTAPANATEIANAREIGYRLTPSEGGGGIVSRTLEGLAGEEKLSKHISQRNAPITNRELGRDVGMRPGETIGPDSFQRVRNTANQAYDAVRGTGIVATDPQLVQGLQGLTTRFRQAAQSFPDNAHIQARLREVENAVQGLDTAAFNADHGITVITDMREAAQRAFRQGDPMMGGMYRDAARLLEDQIDRHLVRTNQSPALLDGFRNARTTLAKTHELEGATHGGDVNPQRYANLYESGAHLRGALTGGAARVGESASAFERSLRNPHNLGNTGSPTWSDAMLGGLSGEWKALLLRPALRGLLASDVGQSMQGLQLSPPATAAMQFGVAPQAMNEENRQNIGNRIDLSRPMISNQDGTFSTERTITIESGGKHYLIPTIVGGKQLSEDEAVRSWEIGSNKAVGVFDTEDEANRAAVARSNEIGRVRNK